MSRLDEHVLGRRRVIGAAAIEDLPGLLARAAVGTVLVWIERSRQRLALLELATTDDHLLRDIAVTREAARREAAKPFWRP